MKVGLELHQQLATGKLFCRCPSELSETVRGGFSRRLRATTGEAGTLDAAAQQQAARDELYHYQVPPPSCLVEADEEPPHPLNPEALVVALTLAELLDARPVDEIQVMRKLVVDGSNTSGFQRTALVAVDGRLRLNGRSYSLPTFCLEEDAARRVEGPEGGPHYRLDRLGIPLLEIATGPEIRSGTEAREVAEALGALLRATRRVRRGIGSVREDVNVSVEGGSRVEIKGVQELRLIARFVEHEGERQEKLLAVREELRARGVAPPKGPALPVTDLIQGSGSRSLLGVIRSGGGVWGLPLPGFGGLLGKGTEGPERLGRELADRARAEGLGGILHSDELPGYGIEEDTVVRVRGRLGVEGSRDAFVLVAGPEPAASRALGSIRQRAEQALEGVPEETRDPLPEGRTRYSRPLPGRHRMYPETDVPPLPVPPELLETVRRDLPERPEVARARLERDGGLNAELAYQLVRDGEVEIFDTLRARGHPPGLVARVLTQDLPPLEERRGTPLAQGAAELARILDSVLAEVAQGRLAKEGVPTVLEKMVLGDRSLSQALAEAGLAPKADTGLESQVEALLDRERTLWETRGMAAFQPLMGHLMATVRGRIDGQVVAKELRDRLGRRLASLPPRPEGEGPRDP